MALTELLIRGSSGAVAVFVVSSTLGVGLSLTVGTNPKKAGFRIHFGQERFAAGATHLLDEAWLGGAGAQRGRRRTREGRTRPLPA